MNEYRIELQALTTKIVTVTAADAHAAAEKALEHAYDDVDEVDRSSWVVAGLSRS